MVSLMTGAPSWYRPCPTIKWFRTTNWVCQRATDQCTDRAEKDSKHIFDFLGDSFVIVKALVSSEVSVHNDSVEYGGVH
jgi:hypothetical protein